MKEIVNAVLQMGDALGDTSVKLANMFTEGEIREMIKVLQNMENDPAPYITKAIIEILNYAINLQHRSIETYHTDMNN